VGAPLLRQSRFKRAIPFIKLERRRAASKPVAFNASPRSVGYSNSDRPTNLERPRFLLMQDCHQRPDEHHGKLHAAYTIQAIGRCKRAQEMEIRLKQRELVWKGIEVLLSAYAHAECESTALTSNETSGIFFGLIRTHNPGKSIHTRNSQKNQEDCCLFQEFT
jgi:hypothetical protein